MPGDTTTLQSSPPRSRLAWYGIPFLLLLVSILFQVASLSRVLGNVYDEGLIDFGAIRVFHGQIPYRDFWTMYGPGQFYALAALFKIASPSVLVEQLWSVADSMLGPIPT
jgi:hypothetical protein